MKLRKFNNYNYTKVLETSNYVIHFYTGGTYYMSTHDGLLLGEKFNLDEPTSADFEKWYTSLRKRALKNISSYQSQIEELQDTITELYDVFDVCPVGEEKDHDK